MSGGGLWLLFALALPAPALAEVAPDPSHAISYGESWFGATNRCDADLDFAPATTAAVVTSSAVEAAHEAARERLVCTGNALLDDPSCWASDPHGLPTSRTGAASTARLRLTSSSAPQLPAPLQHLGGELSPQLLGARAGFVDRLDRPPRA